MSGSPTAPSDTISSGLASRLSAIIARVANDRADGAGLLLMDGDGALRYASATDAPGQVLEMAEELCVEGPCHDAFTDEDAVRTADVSSDSRWPRLGMVLATTPIRAVLGVPVLLDGMAIGALDVFSHDGRVWSDDDVAALRARADGVGLALEEALARDVHDPLVERLHRAIEHRGAIRQAAGIVADEVGLTASAAVIRLRQVAATTGLSVVAVSRRVVEQGRMPLPIELSASAHAVRQAQADHTRLALTDPLTGLANRHRFLDRLGQALARCERGGHRPAVLFIDLDRFKVVNDSLGHEAGDQVLNAVAVTLVDHVRPHDTVARLGGDEFAVLCEELDDPAAVEVVAERVASVLQAPITVTAGVPQGPRRSRDVTVGASVGAAIGSTAGAAQASAVLRDADMAMYAAKGRGGGRVELFSPELADAGHRRMRLELDLRAELDRDEADAATDGIRLVYQPMVSLPDGTPTSVEALVRWTHPELGPLPADELVAVAEESGMIMRLGARVLDIACHAAAGWSRHVRDGDPLIAVNISARQLASPQLVADVRRSLAASGLPPHSLCLELTETQLLEAAPGGALSVIRTLAADGVHLSIDDFGTGYSSLAYLTRLPVTKLKIDRGFVAGLIDDHHDRAVVEAVLGLADALGLRVVAEGVETAEQADAVSRLGCGLAQGYYYSRPVEAAAVPSLLAAR